jgi:hypothetical protein
MKTRKTERIAREIKRKKKNERGDVSLVGINYNI